MAFENSDPSRCRELCAAPGGSLLIDVRTPEEFSAGHVPGAYNVPFLFRGPSGAAPNPEFASTLERHFGKDAALVFQ